MAGGASFLAPCPAAGVRSNLVASSGGASFRPTLVCARAAPDPDPAVARAATSRGFVTPPRAPLSTIAGGCRRGPVPAVEGATPSRGRSPGPGRRDRGRGLGGARSATAPSPAACFASSVFALAVGVRRFWLPLSFTVRDPNGEIGHVFGSALLEIVQVGSYI